MSQTIKQTDELPNLLWIDLETTGLDPKTEKLLEVAVVVTNSDLEEVYAKSWVIFQEIALHELSEFALKTHMENGLLYDVATKGTDLSEVDGELRRLMLRSDIWPIYPLGDNRPPLCGSSINFERQWLAEVFPEFYERSVHYRSVDVSSLKELMKRWDPGVAVSRRNTSKHRAMDDIRDSIDELRTYRAVLWA